MTSPRHSRQSGMQFSKVSSPQSDWGVIWDTASLYALNDDKDNSADCRQPSHLPVPWQRTAFSIQYQIKVGGKQRRTFRTFCCVSSTQRSCTVTSNASPGVSFGSGTIVVGCWARTLWARNNKKAKLSESIGFAWDWQRFTRCDVVADMASWHCVRFT